MPISVELYTDGACRGNPGPGGWACVLVHKNVERRRSGFDPSTTNNRMEMMAVIMGLQSLSTPCHVEITTDSQYVCKAFNEGWLSRWQSMGWRAKNGSPVKNQDLWLKLIELQGIHNLSWVWTRGHSGHHYNELCDTLARRAILLGVGIDERIARA